jgi:nitrite reductase/ring-hydroxylating ferredoxin subunit
MTSVSETLAAHLDSVTPYPHGWFQVAWSEDLPRGRLCPVRFAGRDLVLFRDERGDAHLLDGTCPHLGASLAHGARVVGDRIECPLHGWRFDGQGTCRVAPGLAKLPKARVTTWELRERNRAIFVWHGPPGAPPTYELPSLELDGYRPMRRLEHIGRGRPHDVWENFFDTAHFVKIHRYIAAPVADIEWDGPRARIQHSARTRFLCGSVPMRLDAVLHGPGVAVLRVETLAEVLLVVSATPLDTTTLTHRIALHVRRRLPGFDRLVEAAALYYVREDVRRDLAIWSHKRFLIRPVLCEADGPLHRFRRWYTQFFNTRTGPDGESGAEAKGVS